MSVDRVARDRLASTLAGYMRGDVDNFELDEAALNPDSKTDDAAVWNLGADSWYLYDDFKRHAISVSAEEWEACRRSIAFLRSDLEWPGTPRATGGAGRRAWAVLALTVILISIFLAWKRSPGYLLLPGLIIGVPSMLYEHSRPPPDPDQDRYFPFPDEAQWRAHEHLVEAEKLPAYDPARHQGPTRSSLVATLMTIPGYVVFILFGAPLLALLMLVPRRRPWTGVPT